MEILLIRHGVTDWNQERRLQGREDLPLNAAGIAQAEAAAQALAGIHASLAITSPLSRARVTCFRLAEAMGCGAPIIEPSLIERDFGPLSGTILTDLFSPISGSGIEAVKAVGDRMRQALTRHADAGNGLLLAVSHGAAISALLNTLTEGAIGYVRLRNASGTILRVRENRVMEVVAVDLLPEEAAARLCHRSESE